MITVRKIPPVAVDQTTHLINILFDQLKQAHGLRSDAQLAKHIGTTGMNIGRWRRGEVGIALRIVAPLLVDHAEQIKTEQIAP